MKKVYQVIEMPKPGKEEGIKQVVPIFSVFCGIVMFEIPNSCNIEKVIILYGDLQKTKEAYAKAMAKPKSRR